jgi:uncharacterized protein YaaW (UPF0174 family)
MSRQQSINQRQLEELTKNTKTPLNKKTKSLPVDEVALQYILTYIKNKLQLLQKNIELGTQYLERYYIRIGFWTSKSHPNPDLDRLQIWT